MGLFPRFDGFSKYHEAVILDGFLWGAMEHGNKKYGNLTVEDQLKVTTKIISCVNAGFTTNWHLLFHPILESCKNTQFVLSNEGKKSMIPTVSQKSAFDFFDGLRLIVNEYVKQNQGNEWMYELRSLSFGMLSYCDGFFYMKKENWDVNNPHLADFSFLKEYVSQLKNIEHSFDQYRSILETILRISTNEVIAQGINMVNENNVRAYNDEFLQNLQDYIHAQIDEHESKASDQRKRIKKITKNLSKDDGIRNFIQEMSA